MIPLRQTSLPPLEFNETTPSVKFRVQSSKIAWLHSEADAPGAHFDVTIKDALGRVKFQRKNFGTENTKAGELIRLDTQLGEQLEVVVDNIQGAKSIKLFPN